MSIILVFNFILFGIFTSLIVFFYKTFKLSKEKNNVEGVRNSIALIIVVITVDILYLTFSILIGYPLFPYPFDALILIWIGVSIF